MVRFETPCIAHSKLPASPSLAPHIYSIYTCILQKFYINCMVIYNACMHAGKKTEFAYLALTGVCMHA